MTKEIPLTKGKVVIVDDEYYDELSRYKWRAVKFKNRSAFYACRSLSLPNNKQRLIWMHREIINPPYGKQVDHINGNSLDNRLENLRVCTVQENQCNRGVPKNNTSGYKGVTRSASNSKNWVAQICFNRRHIRLGSYADIVDAAKAYDEAAIRLFGEFARTNF